MKEYDESDLNIIDALESVRRNKQMFLGGEDVIPENLATYIVNDALTLGVAKVEVRHHDEWWLVCSSEDWLGRENDFSVEETFRRLVSLAGGGVEATRREILLTAFADDVFAKKGGEFFWIKGGGEKYDKELGGYFKLIPSDYRIVGFRLTRVPPKLPEHWKGMAT